MEIREAVPVCPTACTDICCWIAWEVIDRRRARDVEALFDRKLSVDSQDECEESSQRPKADANHPTILPI